MEISCNHIRSPHHVLTKRFSLWLLQTLMLQIDNFPFIINCNLKKKHQRIWCLANSRLLLNNYNEALILILVFNTRFVYWPAVEEIPTQFTSKNFSIQNTTIRVFVSLGLNPGAPERKLEIATIYKQYKKEHFSFLNIAINHLCIIFQNVFLLFLFVDTVS